MTTKISFSTLFGTSTHIDDLAPGDLKDKALRIQVQFTAWVAALKRFEICPNSAVNDLMKLFWDLVGQRITPAAMSNVPTVSFAVQRHGTELAGMIMCPCNWLELAKSEPYMQMGALVFTASQAKDYWNFLIPAKHLATVIDRARMYESSFLHTMASVVSDFSPNDYQKKIMDAFPGGIDPIQTYEGMPYTTGKSRTIIRDGQEVVVELRKPVF